MSKYKVIPRANIPTTVGLAFPQSKETDISETGQFAVQGDAAIVDDFIIKPGGEIVVEGGDHQLAGGMNINLFKPLRAWRGTDGKQFEDTDPNVAQIQISPADPTQGRIDLIYAKLEEDVDAGQETRHYKLDPPDPNSVEGDVPVFTEKHNRVVITVIPGTPSDAPAVPDTPAGSAAMYEVTVPAGSTALIESNVRDVRHNFDTLEEVNERLAELEEIVNEQQDNDHRHRANMVDVDAPANSLGPTVQDVLDKLIAQSDDDTDDPIFRPQIIRNDIAPSAEQSGKLGSVGVLDGATPAVDIPAGREVSFFGGARRKLEPSVFPSVVESVAINARLVNKHVDAATQSRENTVNLSLAVISSIESDGGGTYELQGYQLPLGRSRPFRGGQLAAARDNRFIEVMGGAIDNMDSAWYTIDTQAMTVTARAFTGDSPASIRAVFPFGDGTHVLVASQVGVNTNNFGLKWTKVNCVTGACTTYGAGSPGFSATSDGTISCGVVGDLIAPNKIFILVSTGITGGGNIGGENKAWVFHVDTDSFESFTPIGQNPLQGLPIIGILQDVDVCMYKSGQALLLRGIGPQTWVFDYPTRTWTRLQISQPTADISQTHGTRLWGVTVSNVNGRVQMTSEVSSLWELTAGMPPQWTKIGNPAGFGATGVGLDQSSSGRGFVGMVGMISGGLPTGAGYIAGGRVFNQQKTEIWKFSPGGIIETTDCGGLPGLTLGGNTTEATFVIDDGFALPWVVGKVFANPIGNLPLGSIEIAYSFDGVNFIPVKRDTITSVTGSPSNPVRKVRITLRGTVNNRPCISRLNEIFEQEAGAPGLAELVLRFNIVPAGVRYLYISRDGQVTIETTAQQTTPDKCLLMKITPTGGAPTPFDFVNKRHIRRKYTGTKAGGVDPSFSNDFPVLPSFIKAWLKEASGNIKDLADPAITFNTPVVVTGLIDGESYIVELEAGA